MRAWIYRNPLEMSLEEIPDPVISSPSDVIVKIRAVGLCGSDIHGFSGKTGRRYPGMVMGHEIAGEVAGFGPNVTGLRNGRRVVVQPIIYCGECDPCLAGKTSICLNKKMVGVNMDTSGGLCEYLAVPARNVFPVPDELSFAAAALVEPFAVGAGAVRSAGVAHCRNVAIVGSGVIGLTILLMLRESGPERVFMVDNNSRKLAVAESLGAVPVNFAECDPVARIAEQTGGLGADLAFEAVGLSPSVKTAMYVTKPGGRVVWVGNAQQVIELDMQDVVVKAKSIQGVYCYTDDDFRKAVEFIEKNAVLASSLVEQTVPFEEAPEMLARLAKGELELFRAVVCIK